MSKHSFDADDYFGSESEIEKPTAVRYEAVEGASTAETRKERTKKSSSIISKRGSSTKRRKQDEKECLDQLKKTFQRTEQVAFKRDENINRASFAEMIEELRMTTIEQVISKIETTSKAFFHQFKRTSKIQRVKSSDLNKFSLAQLHDEYLKISQLSKHDFDAGQHFVAFLLNNSVQVRLVYFLELDGYFPKRFILRIKRERRPKPAATASVIEKSLTENLVCLQAVIAGCVESLPGNSPAQVIQRLNGRAVFGAFLLNPGPRMKSFCADVSPLYLPDSFWPQVEPNKKFLHMDDHLDAVVTQDGLNATEREELKARIEAYMPRTVAQFKQHPLFIVRAALRRNEIIRPGAKPTEHLFDEQPVYLKADVLPLQGKTKWKMLGRKVREGEAPLKVFEMAIGEKPIEYFAEYQTDLWVPEVIDGKLPVNEYGNIELFVGVPKKCAHLTMKGVWRAAKTLGVEYSQAVTGFDKRRGRNFVVKEGIVIHKKDEKAVKAQYVKMMEEINAKEAKKQHDQTITQWKKLFKVLLVKKYMKKNYYK